MHISFVLETLRCRKLVLHQLEKRTTEERYDWYEAKSLKWASMAVSSEYLTNMVDGLKLHSDVYYIEHPNLPCSYASSTNIWTNHKQTPQPIALNPKWLLPCQIWKQCDAVRCTISILEKNRWNSGSGVELRTSDYKDLGSNPVLRC